MKQRRFARILSIVMLVAIACMMFFFSAEDGNTSAMRSAKVARIVARLFVPGYVNMASGEQARVISHLQHPIRKAGHMAEYALLGFWLCVFLRSLGIRGWKNPLLCLVCAALLASCDEWHQIFVSGRGPSIVDVGIDCAGATIGLLVGLAVLGVASSWLKSREAMDA